MLPFDSASTSAPAGTAAATAGKAFVCAICGKSYQRSTHLRRHEATHVNTARFSCQECGKTFARSDVCRKHMLSCSKKDGRRGQAKPGPGQRPEACEACHQSKTECDTGMPCASCASRHLACHYRDVVADGDSVCFSTAASTPSSDTPSTAGSRYLRGLTNPATETMMELFQDTAVNEDVPDLDVDSKFSGMSLSMINLEEIDMSPWDFASFLDDPTTSAASPEDFSATFAELKTWVPVFTDEGFRRLEYISDEILAALSKTHLFLDSNDPSYVEAFDQDLAQTVFSADSLTRFISIFFRLGHIHLPLVHIPTFGLEDTPPVLVLAVALVGALRSPPRDDAVSTRRFCTVADEYIFRHLQIVFASETKAKPSKKLLYALQAAIIILNTQYLRNDAQSRQRARHRRLPTLVAAVRQLKLNSYRHSGSIVWDDFIYEELCIRVAHWTALADWHQCGMFHVQPQVTIKEMMGNMPCPLEVWDAIDARGFDAKLKASGYMTRPPNFSSMWNFYVLLTKDELDEGQRIPTKSLTLLDLSAALSIISSVSMSNHLSGTAKASGPMLLRALERWHTLWNAVASKLDAKAFQSAGMAGHSPEMSFLVQKIIKVAMSDDEPLFLKHVGHESLYPLFEFISRH